MKNFVFHNPTKIIFGGGTAELIGTEAAQYGSRALLVFGRRSVFATGLYDRVLAALGAEGLSVVEHGGVRPNPVLSHVRDGIATARKHEAQMVIAVGGGSVLDSAKAIAAGALADHDVWQFFRGKKSVKKSLPVICLPTLAASGSEMNGGMVLTNEESRQKFGMANRLLFPRVSILDPTLTFTVDAAYTSYGAVDAIAHGLEFYLNAEEGETPLQDRLLEGLLESIMGSCEKVLAAPRDYNGRAELMWGAALALNGIMSAGLGKVGFPMHMIEHSLSALYDVAHGAGLAAVIPAYLQFHAARSPAKIVELARRLFRQQNGSADTLAASCIDSLREWFRKIGAPVSLSELGIPSEDIPAIADNALALAKLWRIRGFDATTIATILRLAV